MKEKTDILVVAAHPDDAEFGVAGSVAQWVRGGKSVVYAVCTSGEKGTSNRTVKPEALARLREEEQRAAAKVLGVREVVFLRFPDQGLEDTPAFRKEIVRCIRTFRPDTVVTADPYRRYIWHRDHRMCGQATMDAVYPYARDFLAYPDLIDEGLEPHKVGEMLFWGSPEPNYRINVTDTFDVKLAALRCHKSQVNDRFSDVEEWVRGRAREMAEGESYKLAEAFHREEVWM